METSGGASAAIGWSAIQSWVVKGISLGLFFVLARLLGKEEFGKAQSALLILMLISLLAEQGLLQAIIQIKGLTSRGLNAPFFLMLGLALVLSGLLYLFSHPLSNAVGLGDGAYLLRWASAIPPFTVLVIFLSAILKRRLDTRSTARAAIIGSIASVPVALVLALHGAGGLSLIIQVLVMNVIQAGLLWRSAQWRPSLDFDFVIARQLLKFSSAVFLSRCVDFSTGRSIEFLLLLRTGPAGLGTYAIASKIHLTLVELMAQAFFDVSLGILSQLRSAAEKLKEAYLTVVFIAATLASPVFILLSLISADVCEVLFGTVWRDSGLVLMWLCLLGASEVVQYFNGAAVNATGRPRWILYINLAKLCVVAVSIGLIPGDGAQSLVRNYVVALLIVSPVSFYAASRAVGVSLYTVLIAIAPSFACMGFAALGTDIIGQSVEIPQPVFRIVVQGSVFVGIYLILLRVFLMSRLRDSAALLRSIKVAA